MLQSKILLALASIIASASALPSVYQRRQAQTIVGVATFNDYSTQKGGTVCGNMGVKSKVDNINLIGAAAGDLSPQLSAGRCDGTNSNPKFTGYDKSQCDIGKHQALPHAPHPACPHVKCNVCYGVASFGEYGSPNTGAQQHQSIIVQIIDVCPAGSALNYCKDNVPLDERCGQGNSLDIDYSGYKKLTGTAYNQSPKHPNLKIHITPVSCP